MATKKSTTTARRRRKKAEPATRGLSATEVRDPEPPVEIQALRRLIESDGGGVIGAYRDPLGGKWQVLASLPLERVKPTSFQRNLSETHVKRLSQKIDRLDRFLDPVIVVRQNDGIYLTPNGFHRSSAMQQLGARSIVAIVVPDERIAYQILALNTEKAHNVREKSLEAIRMERELADVDPDERELGYADQFEEAPFLTLGLCYEEKGNFSGGAYYAVLKRVDSFLDEKLCRALGVRSSRAQRLFKLDSKVVEAVEELKERGLKSPYLKTFVVARINPLRFRKVEKADFDETFDKMMDSLSRFDPSKIRPDHLAGVSGPPPEE